MSHIIEDKALDQTQAGNHGGDVIVSSEKEVEASPVLEKGPEQVQEITIVSSASSETNVGSAEVLDEALKAPEHVQETSIDSSSSSEKDVEAAQTSPSHGPKATEGPQLPKWRLLVIGACLCSGLFLSLLDGTIVATALFSIGDEFNVLGDVSWVALAYTLTYLGCCVIFSSLSDVVGRRNAYIAAFLIFFGFSIGAGFSRSLNELIACRAMQGLGGAGLYSLCFVIFPEIAPPSLQQFIGMIAGLTVAVASVMGPLLGGILTHYTTWRWCFWMNAPIGILPFLGFIIAWPSEDQMPSAPKRRPFRNLDFAGCVLMIAASVLTVFAFQEGGVGGGHWSDAIFIGPIVGGAACWVMLVGWEVVVARFWEATVVAIFPLRLMKRRIYMAAMFSTIMAGFINYVAVYSLPLRFQVVNQKSAFDAGIGLLPMLISSAIGSTVGGVLNGKKNFCFYTLVAGGCSMLLGTGLMSTLSPTAYPEARTYGFQVFVGLGFGLTISTTSLLAILECQIRDAAVATGIIAQVRVLGGSIGIAASTAILGVTQRRELTGIVTAGELAALQHVEGTLSPEQLNAVRDAYSETFTHDMNMCTAVAAVYVLVTLCTWQRNNLPPLERRKQQIAEEVERQTKLAEAKARKEAEKRAMAAA